MSEEWRSRNEMGVLVVKNMRLYIIRCFVSVNILAEV